MISIALPNGINGGSTPVIEPILVNVLSAVNDTVTITDNLTGETSQCVTDINGTGTALLIPDKEYTFTSSIAKAIDGSSDYYSRSVTVVKDMPDVQLWDGINIYWYGNDNNNYGGFNYFDWTESGTASSSNNGATFQTNSISIRTSVKNSKQVDVLIGTNLKVDVTNLSRIRISFTRQTSIYNAHIAIASIKQFANRPLYQPLKGNTTGDFVMDMDVSNYTGDYYICFRAYHTDGTNSYDQDLIIHNIIGLE